MTTAEQIQADLKIIKTYLDQGWSLEPSLRRAGYSRRTHDYLYKSDEYKKFAIENRRTRNYFK